MFLSTGLKLQNYDSHFKTDFYLEYSSIFFTSNTCKYKIRHSKFYLYWNNIWPVVSIFHSSHEIKYFYHLCVYRISKIWGH